MATAYGSRAGVARIARGQIRFSDALYSISPDVDNNHGTIELLESGITMDDAFAGYRLRFELRFENAGDLTEYRVYKQNDLDGSTAMNFLAVGNTAAPLVLANIMTIAVAGWVGAAVVNDVIYIITNSHISNDDADEIINDIEAEVDDALRKLSIASGAEGTIPTDLYFVLTAPPVPRAITIYTNHIAAYRMLNYIFDSQKGVTPTGRDEERNQEDYQMVYKWAKIAQMAFKEWLSGWNVAHSGNAPRWTSTQPMITRTGIEGQLHGVLEQESDGDYTTSDEAVDPFGDIESLLSSS